MNYPVWEVWFGSGLLIAIVAILHVFVSHFAVGSGLFLVITEKKAYRENDNGLLDWLKQHTAFFVLVSIVWGAVTGVGIWFTIGLISPSATSSLIHIYVWAWAMEWVFFAIEVIAALMYLYGWNKLDQKTHLWIGWVYFISAYMSLFLINGIITFMLTSGKWIETYSFWQGFFNPTFLPSLFVRSFLSFALAGVYALLTAAIQKDKELKGRLITWSSKWIVYSFILLPIMAYWYIASIPSEVWINAAGKMPTATRYTNLVVIFSVVTFVLALITLIKPKRVPLALSVAIFLAAFGTVGSFEYIREAIRKPYIISNYMYSNSIYKEPVSGDRGMNVQNINEKGILKVAKWVEIREITEYNKLKAGREIFRLECRSCHTLKRGYRGIKPILEERNLRDPAALMGILSVLNFIPAENIMPPFSGTNKEKEALAYYLASIVAEK